MPCIATESAKPGEEFTTAPRRSSRIKDQPTKEVPAPKKTKPRAKKADKEAADKEEKPKSSRGKKRKAVDDVPNGDADEAALW